MSLEDIQEFHRSAWSHVLVENYYDAIRDLRKVVKIAYDFDELSGFGPRARYMISGLWAKMDMPEQQLRELELSINYLDVSSAEYRHAKREIEEVRKKLNLRNQE